MSIYNNYTVSELQHFVLPILRAVKFHMHILTIDQNVRFYKSGQFTLVSLKVT